MKRFQSILSRSTRSLRALARAAVFFLKVFPMLPSRPVDWVTPSPVVEKVRYPTGSGFAEGEVYRPAGPGPFPAILVCLGVVPFGVDHPQVPVLGKALARAGFAALLYWSPAMRDFRLDPVDIENISLGYDWLIRQPYGDPARSGMLGTCVGGAFALMAAASPLIRNRVAFLSAYAPYCSMWTFARDIASASRMNGDRREPWRVYPLTRRVFVHSLTGGLDPEETEWLRGAFAVENASSSGRVLSPEGRAVYALLTARDAAEADAALLGLPAALQQRLTVMLPVNYVKDLRVPLFIQLHDAGDQVIPISESRSLHAALAGDLGTHYTEMQFSHLDPVKGRLPFFRLVREFGKFFHAIYPLFRLSVAES